MKTLFVAINAKYIHSSLAVRYLYHAGKKRNLDVDFVEFSINNHLKDIAYGIFDKNPQILCLAVYIWNIEIIKLLIPFIKLMLPKVKIILGGPEVSYEGKEIMEKFPQVDYIIRGEGEETTISLLNYLLDNKNAFLQKGLIYRKDDEIIETCAITVEDLNTLPFPYDQKDIEDLKHKIIYYESSRGCPYSCKYCLSCATQGVRYRNLDLVFKELDFFIAKNVRQVKFVDRTFNAHKEHFLPILEYISKLDNSINTNFHFEIVAYKMDDDVINVLKKMPKGRVQFEIGVQSTNENTLKNVSRANHYTIMVDNIKKLLQLRTIHLHLDLIIGLPYEDLISFKKSFNDVLALKPQELQIGFLKLLKGAGMNDLVAEHKYSFMPQAPYQIIRNKYLDFDTIRKLEIFVEVFELYANSGLFKNTLDRVYKIYDGDSFTFFYDFSRFFYRENLHQINHSAHTLVDYLVDFIKTQKLKEEKLLLDLLKIDMLQSFKGKHLSKKLPWETLPKEMKNEFFKSDKIKKYIEDYEFISWRDLHKNFHLEIFHHLNKEKQLILFNYQDITLRKIVDWNDIK